MSLQQFCERAVVTISPDQPTLMVKLGNELPGPMAGFGQLHRQAVAGGTL